jgi:uncharacterized protein YdhG (YjbR/CyaY superfamily)
MPTASGDRSAQFPAIEKKHGQPVAFFLKQLAGLGAAKYEEQMAYLQENHGFSRAHANAVVMYHRGSTTSKRFATPDAYFVTLQPQAATTVRAIIDAIVGKYPKLELVMAWNQPMLRLGKHYVFGVSVAKQHVLLLPLGESMEQLATRLAKYETNKKTIKVPLDWKVDAALLRAMVKIRLDELG